jgi:hypothetical protein
MRVPDMVVGVVIVWNVMLTAVAAVALPRVKKRPIFTLKATVALVLLIVSIVAPVPVNVTSAVPPILIELRLIEGTFDIIPAAVKLMITSSPASGTVPPDQFAPTFHAPAPANAHVFVAANVRLLKKVMSIITNAHFCNKLCDIPMELFTTFCVSDFTEALFMGSFKKSIENLEKGFMCIIQVRFKYFYSGIIYYISNKYDSSGYSLPF